MNPRALAQRRFEFASGGRAFPRVCLGTAKVFSGRPGISRSARRGPRPQRRPMPRRTKPSRRPCPAPYGRISAKSSITAATRRSCVLSLFRLNMRKLQDFPTETAAHQLSDYLETQGIESRVRDEREGFAVWVLLDSEVERAQELIDQFDPERVIEFEKAAAKIREKREQERKPVFTPQVGRAAVAPRRWATGVMLLVAISALVALASQLGRVPIPALYIAPLQMPYFLPLDWTQPWRFVTPIFMHSGIFHILFNMMWLYHLGGQIESNEGTLRFLLIVLASAVASNLAQYYLKGPNFGGMSGVNYALFACCWMMERYAPRSGYLLPRSTTWWLMGWLVLGGTGLLGAVANVAHAVGLMAGLTLALPVYVRFRRSHKLETRFEKGSWADVNVQGFQRFDRLVLQPYLPAWFLAVALVVVWFDL